MEKKIHSLVKQDPHVRMSGGMVMPVGDESDDSGDTIPPDSMPPPKDV